jgi:excisionase family DNA binding protein
MNAALDRNRLDPSQFNEADQASMERLNDVLVGTHERPSLCVSSEEFVLPEPLFKLMKRVVLALKEGKPVILIPETESLTTQAAADFLGVSRPFLIDLLNHKKIPHHKVGTHRRIYLKDLHSFMRERDRARHEALDELNDKIEKADLYERIPPDVTR